MLSAPWSGGAGAAPLPRAPAVFPSVLPRVRFPERESRWGRGTAWPEGQPQQPQPLETEPLPVGGRLTGKTAVLVPGAGRGRSILRPCRWVSEPLCLGTCRHALETQALSTDQGASSVVHREYSNVSQAGGLTGGTGPRGFGSAVLGWAWTRPMSSVLPPLLSDTTSVTWPVTPCL